MNQKQKALNALMEKPSNYYIEVKDNSMLPKEVSYKEKTYKDCKDLVDRIYLYILKSLKKNRLIEVEEIKFTIAPPSTGVLAMCANHLQEIPAELLKADAKPTLRDMLPYAETLLKVICIIAHAKESDFPEWWLSFLKANTTPKDVYQLFHETAFKLQSDFFLTSFQIASQINPMMMRKIKKEDSTPSN